VPSHDIARTIDRTAVTSADLRLVVRSAPVTSV